MRRFTKIVLRISMDLSDLRVIGPIFIRLARMMVGPYKDKRILAYLTRKPYVSPGADISCSRLRIGRSAFIDDRVTIYGSDDDGSVLIGDLVHLYRGTNIEVGSGGRVIVGANTHVQGPSDLKGFLRDLVIGSEVQIAPFCCLSCYNHAIDDLTRPMRQQGLISRGDTILEDDVWLGAGVKVMGGVRIGRGSVIGAGSVVTRDIPPYSIAMGVPAVVVKKRGNRLERPKEAVKA